MVGLKRIFQTRWLFSYRPYEPVASSHLNRQSATLQHGHLIAISTSNINDLYNYVKCVPFVLKLI